MNNIKHIHHYQEQTKVKPHTKGKHRFASLFPSTIFNKANNNITLINSNPN